MIASERFLCMGEEDKIPEDRIEQNSNNGSFLSENSGFNNDSFVIGGRAELSLIRIYVLIEIAIVQYHKLHDR